MAGLDERIAEDYKRALKAGERLRVDTLRLVRAAIQRASIEKRRDALDDPEIMQVLAQQAKQRRETIEAARSTTRTDVAEQAARELEILMPYLPQPLSPEALGRLIEEAVAAVGPQQGPVMK